MSIDRSMHGRGLSSWILMVLLVSSLVAGDVAHAQYFGRNKVQYETFDFKTLQTPHLRILYYPSARQATIDAARMGEEWYDRFSNLFNHELAENQPVIFYANHADFQQTNVISGMIGQGTGGVTEGLQNRVVMPFTGSYAENNHVLGHELVHAFQYSIIKESASGLAAAQGLPLWFVEGMAEYLSLGREYPLTAMWLRDAVLHDEIPSISDITGNPSYFPYRWGHAFWAWVTGQHGDDMVPQLMYGAVAGGFQRALEEILAAPLDSISAEWKSDIKETYTPQLADRIAPSEIGQPALQKGEAAMTLSPSISPDGRYAAFIARRDIFTMNLYLADLDEGKIIEQLASSNSDAHFDALQFIGGSGSWSPDGSQLAFIVFEDGNNAIAIIDVDSRKVVRTINPAGVDAISQLAWSPRGSSILLSGSTGGISDLYLFHLDTDELERITNDRFAQIHPAWSPDGSRLAYATDAGDHSDFDRLAFAPLQLAVMDLDTRAITFLAMSDDAKHVNPQFSPEGDLLFLANPDGFSDIYRYSFDDDAFYRVTRVATGVTGLTEDSPALSVAAASGTMLFTVFDNRQYQLRRMEADQTGEEYIAEPDAFVQGASLPPQFAETQVSEYLRQPTNGSNGHGNGNGNGNGHETETMQFNFGEYKPSLKLAYIGQSGVGVGFDRFGARIGGGASFLFTDLLGNRMLGITAQAGGRLKDIGGEAFYVNQRSRFNWGVGGGHIPYLSAYLQFRDSTAGGQPVLVQELVREWTFFDRIDFMAEYPLSTNRRLEFTTGYSHVWYDLDAEGVVIDNGFIVDDYQRDLAAPSPLDLWHGSGAYVGDYSLFGFTSPVRGTRYRFEVEPTFGTLTFITALADFRQYFFLNPFTLAFRGMHIGRYLDDAENERLSDLFVGYPTLVRGYDAYSLEPEECTSGDCPVYSRLLGSRLAVVNAEIRLPLFGTDEFGLVDFGYLPTELALFLDGGAAWTADDPINWKLSERSSDRIPVFSAGVAARVNVLGFIIGQFYLAWPFQRPEKDTEFGFLIAPGW